MASGWNDDLLTDANLAKVEELSGFAESKERSVLELAISWLLERPMVASVIAGATTPEQVRANAAAADWDMSEAELKEVNRIVPGSNTS